MEDEQGVSQGLILGCPIALALVMVAVLLVLVIGAAILAFGFGGGEAHEAAALLALIA